MSRNRLISCGIMLLILCLHLNACVTFKSPVATPPSGEVTFIAPPKIPAFPSFTVEEKAAFSGIINALLGWSQDVGKWGAQVAKLKHDQALPVVPDMPRFTKEEWQKMTPAMRQKVLNYAAEVTGWVVKLKRHHWDLK